MRIWLLLFLAAAIVSGSAIREAQAQRSEISKTGTVSAKPTGIEVTSPLTNRKLPDPADAKITAYAQALLKQFDSDRNGVVDGDELKNVRAEYLRYDSDKDGKLTLDEINAGLQQRFAAEQPVAAVAVERVPRKLIAFEFVVIERTGAELAEEKDKAPTVAQLLKLEKDGKAGSVQRLKLTALENVEARLQLGEDAPFISGRTQGSARGGFGGAQEWVTYNSLGTTVTLTAEMETDGKVLASINLARSTVAAPPKAPEKVDGQETVVSTNYPRRLQNTIVSTVRIAPGETVVVAGQQTHTGSSPGELWVLVTAKVE